MRVAGYTLFQNEDIHNLIRIGFTESITPKYIYELYYKKVSVLKGYSKEVHHDAETKGGPIGSPFLALWY